MDKKSVEFIKSLKPTDLPNGMDVLKEGIAMGNKIKAGKSLFLKESGFDTFQAYKEDCAARGEVIFEILLGMATLEEQVDAIKKIYEFGQRTGLNIRTVQCVPSVLVALPKEYRENAPEGTSYLMETLDDYLAHQADVPMQVFFEDHILCCPNSIESTTNAIIAGSERCGLVSQFIWSQPGFSDHRQHMIDLVKSIGMVASKRDEGFICDTFMDDGLPGFAMDCVTYVGYALLEHHIVHKLCGARHQISYGNLLSEYIPRLAFPLAIHKLLSTKEENAIGYVNGATIYQWDHDIESNYGPAAQEMLLEILFERHYKMGLQIDPVSITEKITVPTLQDLLNIFSVGARLCEQAPAWDALMNWTPIEDCADIMMKEGTKFFENAMAIFKEAGINTEDPLEMFMVIKKINPSKFEAIFHHNKDKNGTVVPLIPSVLGRQTIEMTKEIVKELHEVKGLEGNELEGVKIAVASGDTHTYGLYFVDDILTQFGAEVINGGVDIDPPELLDLADEEGLDFIGISVHNGQGLEYAKQLVELAKKRGKKYNMILGGMLNALLPGESVPVDVQDKINELGVFTSNDTCEMICKLKSWKS